jgi:signal transduction histidine kinase
MNRHINFRKALPALLIGLVMLGICAAGVRSINQLQSNLGNVLTQTAASLRSAQDLEIKLRQLRFHFLTYNVDRTADRAALIQDDHVGFETALRRARAAAVTDKEKALLVVIGDGYAHYREELEQDNRPDLTLSKDLVHWIDTHPVRKLVAPCQELVKLNLDEMQRIAEETEFVSGRARTITLGLALLGPLGGLIGGFGLARGLSRAVSWLNVWVRDVHSRLDQEAGSIQLTTEGVPETLDDQVQPVVARVQDMVDRLQRQQQQILRAEQLAAVGQLAAGMAHEIRNPLMTIKLLIGVALRGSPETLSVDDLRVIHSEIERLEKTVQGLLDFARLPRADRQVCDLGQLIDQAVELVGMRAAQQHVALEFHKPDGAVSIAVDRNQMHTVLVNLLLNALDAMPRGGRLEVELNGDGEHGFKVDVRDTGTGIAPEMADRLFTPFATSKPTGTGLGLSISRRIVEGHGGQITGRNRSEGGACFTVQLPCRVEDEAHADVACCR